MGVKKSRSSAYRIPRDTVWQKDFLVCLKDPKLFYPIHKSEHQSVWRLHLNPVYYQHLFYREAGGLFIPIGAPRVQAGCSDLTFLVDLKRATRACLDKSWSYLSHLTYDDFQEGEGGERVLVTLLYFSNYA